MLLWPRLFVTMAGSGYQFLSESFWERFHLLLWFSFKEIENTLTVLTSLGSWVSSSKRYYLTDTRGESRSAGLYYWIGLAQLFSLGCDSWPTRRELVLKYVISEALVEIFVVADALDALRMTLDVPFWNWNCCYFWLLLLLNCSGK